MIVGVTAADEHTEHGDGRVARSGEILRTVVGSGVHGIALAGTDDHDEMGIFVEPPEFVLGCASPWTTMSGAPSPRVPGPGRATPTW